MKTNKNKLVSFQEHLDKEYRAKGIRKRKKLEQGFQALYNVAGIENEEKNLALHSGI